MCLVRELSPLRGVMRVAGGEREGNGNMNITKINRDSGIRLRMPAVQENRTVPGQPTTLIDTVFRVSPYVKC